MTWIISYVQLPKWRWFCEDELAARELPCVTSGILDAILESTKWLNRTIWNYLAHERIKISNFGNKRRVIINLIFIFEPPVDGLDVREDTFPIGLACGYHVVDVQQRSDSSFIAVKSKLFTVSFIDFFVTILFI